MSGHSKWHNIQKTKGAADAKRSQIFTKIAREMIVAVKTGGSGDPANNSRLAAVIAKAKAANMPNDNIKRTIDKALGAGNTDNFENVVYEGYGPNGVAVIVDALTDNRNRAASDVRLGFTRHGGSLADPGSVSYLFSRRGIVEVPAADGVDEESIMMAVLDAGAEEVEDAGELFIVESDPKDVVAVRTALQDAGIDYDSAEVQFVASTEVELDLEGALKVNKLIDALEDSDDVQNIYTNMSLSDEVRAQLEEQE